MTLKLPSGLSVHYWRSWSHSTPGATISESLDEGEEWIGSCDGVGLYEGYAYLHCLF